MVVPLTGPADAVPQSEKQTDSFEAPTVVSSRPTKPNNTGGGTSWLKIIAGVILGGIAIGTVAIAGVAVAIFFAVGEPDEPRPLVKRQPTRTATPKQTPRTKRTPIPTATPIRQTPTGTPTESATFNVKTNEEWQIS